MRLTYCAAVGPQFPDDHSRESFTWAGTSRNISCSPLAEPPATVEWIRFQQRIVNNDTYRIINTANTSYLQVLEPCFLVMSFSDVSPQLLKGISRHTF